MTREELRADLTARARRSTNEICGYVGGRDGVPQRVYEAHNVRQSPAEFDVTREEQEALLTTMYERDGLELCAVFHSHPQGPAYFSGTDIGWAREWPRDVAHLVIGLEPESFLAVRFDGRRFIGTLELLP